MTKFETDLATHSMEVDSAVIQGKVVALATTLILQNGSVRHLVTWQSASRLACLAGVHLLDLGLAQILLTEEA